MRSFIDLLVTLIKSHLDERKCDLLECIVWVRVGQVFTLTLDFIHIQVSKAYNFC